MLDSKENRSWIFMCAGSKAIASLVNNLKISHPKKKIYGIDVNLNIDDSHKNIFENFYSIPFPNDDNFITSLINIIEEIGPSMLIPGADEEAYYIGDYKNIIEKHNVLCNVMSGSIIKSLMNKLYMTEKVSKLNPDFSVNFTQIYNNNELKNICEQMGYPNKKIILKPIIGRGRRNTYIISEKYMKKQKEDMIPSISLSEILKKDIIKHNSMMVMQYVEGESVTIDVLANKGVIIKTVIRKWNKNWRFPFPGQQIIIDKKIDKLIKIISKVIKLHGLIDIDVIKTKDGRIVFLEVNPRPSGSAVVSEVAGIPIFSLLENILEEKKINKKDFKYIKEINNI
jgi:predicted ATP-grasp superfamily ATP-dependent carboligase